MILNFNGKDLELLKQKGISLEEILRQISIFKNGIEPIKIVAPATVQNGAIKVLSAKEIESYIKLFDSFRQKKVLYKFTPASGAATRMFKKLYAFADSEDLEPVEPEIIKFFNNIDKFAFYDDLQQLCKQKFGKSVEQLLKQSRYKNILSILLDDGLKYGHKPKALIKFHRYDGESRTAMEEHLVEAFGYSVGKDDSLELHFTVSPEHQSQFEQLAVELREKYAFKNYRINFSFSQQKPSTDTIAVDMDNQPFRKEDGSLLFRPGGHGSLIYNLNNIDADIFFIKNIDNVAPDRLKHDTETYFNVLAGMLVALKNRIDAYNEILSIGAEEKDLDDIYKFIENVLNIKPKLELKSLAAKIEFAKKILNRPLRVAGMVKNTGEPGGGPFLVDYGEYVSPQIVESSQVDLSNPQYAQVFKSSTHFNPVFMVLSVRDFKGNKYNLLDYVDDKASFIAVKSYKGKEIKALERPGLWNGAMAFWNTVFVEVPLTVFNPVKTVCDLLKPNHQ